MENTAKYYTILHIVAEHSYTAVIQETNIFEIRHEHCANLNEQSLYNTRTRLLNGHNKIII